MNALKSLATRPGTGSILLLAALLLVVFPLTLDIFRLNLIGKYLTYGFVAIGLVMLWGHAGILSLGQGVFFGLGGYMMAMFLKLEASAPNLPDFMEWSSVEVLPTWWEPSKHFGVTLLEIFLLPIVIAFPFSYAIFRKRVSGVYFAIVTIALAMTMTVLIIGQQGDTGGANGITDFKTLLGIDVITPDARRKIYYLEVVLLIIVAVLAAMLLQVLLVDGLSVAARWVMGR